MISDPPNQFPSLNPTLSAKKWQSHSSHVHPHLLSGEHKAPAAKHGREHDAAAFVAPAIACSPLGHWQPLFKPSHRKKTPTPLQFNPNSGEANKLETLHTKVELREGGRLCARGRPPDASIKTFHGAFYSERATWPNETDRADCVCSCVCLCVRVCMRRHPFTLHLWCVLPLWGMHAVALWTSTLAAPAVAKQLQTGCSHARLWPNNTFLLFFVCLFLFVCSENDRGKHEWARPDGDPGLWAPGGAAGSVSWPGNPAGTPRARWFLHCR